ncbi:MAG: type II secretion system protein, partial [Verrucomicrobiales bacterium]|nr:type II secretion system protein [Verrucomicrobiales bacterium]
MKPRHPQRGGSAFTLIELLVTIGIIGILAAMLLPALTKAKAKARQAACANHLRQQGIAFHAFAHDHGGLFPQGVSTNNGGALEVSGRPEPWFGQVIRSPAPFAAISNELGTPKVLACPAVVNARVGTNFASLKVENLGYALHAAASLGDTLGVLALDRNVDLTRSRRVTNGTVPGMVSVVWTPERHSGRGNTLWGDAHVELRRNVDLLGGAGNPGLPGTSGGGGSRPTSGSGGSPS